MELDVSRTATAKERENGITSPRYPARRVAASGMTHWGDGFAGLPVYGLRGYGAIGLRAARL